MQIFESQFHNVHPFMSRSTKWFFAQHFMTSHDFRLSIQFYFLQYGRTAHLMKCEDNERRYRGADKSLARPTSRYILFDGENVSFDASLVIYRNSTNIHPNMIINTIYENQNLLSL
jgi:hypothetical protein